MLGRASVRPVLSRAEALLLGELSLSELSSAELGIFWAGWHEGRASLEPELERLKWEANRLFLALNNPGREGLRAYTDRMIDKLAERLTAEDFLVLQDGFLAELVGNEGQQLNIGKAA